jgi:hypothetical protein
MRDSQTGRMMWESKSLGESLYKADPFYDEISTDVPKYVFVILADVIYYSFTLRT